jgi:hypothetical protein
MTAALILDQVGTWHSTNERAQAIIDRMGDDLDGWSYRVEQRGKWFVIAVYDEAGQRLGEL